ncbi:DnaJ domain [Macleaya cordata]|uniref:DnaJ domain n=1 Tax=Macleaya cordata TaxID=56857 RepID=A0A200QSZ6_MACCD|nr:DnaJ domain [Macleaya cordata]
MAQAVAAILAVFVGFTLAILVIALSATVALWMCGSFWTTGLVIAVGGLGFALKSERFSLLITTIYSVYCARVYVGWLGLLLALNLSFISSDVLIHFLKNNVNEHRRSYRPQEQTPEMRGQPGSFFAEPMNASPSETGFGKATDRSAGEPSTSGADMELTSEEEVVRLLNCTDHYTALGLSRYENIDVSSLKREYRKKAMLVHPDKNMGDEKAAEAFKKLQNAYEVLLDSLKREAYNDELRREELLNWFRRFQSSSQMNGRHDLFASGFTHSEADGKEPLGDLRRIACKKCRKFHIWIHINRSKSQARWCQECKDFHQAKDGDGWVEQSSKPFFFGMLQKVDAPSAYVCAESRIYDATEWFICQGMRCPANTHKPSFHVNTSVTSKHGNMKGSGGSGQKWGGMPSANMEESMTEEEFLEWLQNAMQSGMFEAAAAAAASGNPPPPESPSAGAKNFTKTSGSGGSSSTKKKKKGKKQW